MAACYTLGVFIDLDDINDATGNTDVSKNNKVYIDYTDCSGAAKTIYFEGNNGNIENDFDNICVDWDNLVTLYYYKNNTVSTASNSYATDFDSCTTSIETSIAFSCVNPNGLRAYNVSAGFGSGNPCGGEAGPWPNVIYGNNPNAWNDCTIFYEDAFGVTPFDGLDNYFSEETQTGVTLSIASNGFVLDRHTGC